MVDVTVAWMLSASAAMPTTGAQSAIVRFGRWQFARAFVKRFDMKQVAARASAVADWKAADTNMSGLENATMRRLAAEATRIAGGYPRLVRSPGGGRPRV